MLVRAVKPSFEGFHDAAKQLLIWALNKKNQFNTQKRDYYSPKRSHKPWGRQRRDNFDLFDREEKYEFNEELKPVVKDFYQFHPDVQNRPQEVIREFHAKHDIKIFGKGKNSCPPPILSFDELNLPDQIYNVIRRLDYTTPTPVQSQTWPLALAGHNMVGISRTGSGKTFGFVLPALFHIQHQLPVERNEGPVVLIIAPTRELVQQIMRVIAPFERALSLRTTALFGGVSKVPQFQKISRGTEICVATPGRLIDLLKENVFTLSRCTYCVLDEADRLLDMGFEPQIQAIMDRSREDKQVLMWSATWPKEVRNLAESFLVNYVGVQFGSVELAANPNITQHVHLCQESKKPSLLKNILEEINQERDNKTIIFVRTKMKAETVSLMVRRFGYSSMAIHGDKSQMERDKCLRLFREGKIKILVGTLVVGRGLDITDIRYVINYDFPTAIEDYIHVIGRTARNESTGVSHTFFAPEDRTFAPDLINVLKEANQEVSPELLQIARYHERVKEDGDEFDPGDKKIVDSVSEMVTAKLPRQFFLNDNLNDPNILDQFLK